MTAAFWTILALIVWSLGGYGLTWIALARVWPRRSPAPEVPQCATMLIAARNEEAGIGAKITSVLAQETGPHALEILVVSDGSEDATVARARAAAGGDPTVTVVETPDHGGKAAALNHGLAMIGDDRVVIFSDANSILAPGAVRALLAPLGDPGVGGTMGQLDIPDGGGPLDRAERLFWRYDNAMKAAEDRIGGAVSAQGTLYAVRRALVRPVPEGMADDLVTSLAVVDQGHRLAFASGAVAREGVTGRVGAEMARRLRSTERGWRGLMAFARLMNPARTGAYAVQLFNHKLMRRVVAFLLPALFVLNLPLLDDGWVYGVLFALQVAVHGGALLAWGTGLRFPGASVLVLFTLGHAVIAWAIVRWAAGVRTTKWAPVRDG